MKLIIISDSEPDSEEPNALFRRPTLKPFKSKWVKKNKRKKRTKCKSVDKTNKLILNDVLYPDRVLRSSRNITEIKNYFNNKDYTQSNNMLNISASEENQCDSVSQFIRDDKKLLLCFVLLERIDVHDLRTTNLNINSVEKLSNDNLRTAFNSKISNDFSRSLQRSTNVDYVNRSEFECQNDVNKLSNRNNDTDSQFFVERLQDDTLQNTEESAEHKNQVKRISKWTLSLQASAQFQPTIEGYIDGKKFSKVPVTCRLTSRKFRSLNQEIFYLHGNIYDPDNCIPLPLKTEFKEGLPRYWKSKLKKWIQGGIQVSQESVKLRNKKPVAQESNDKTSFDLDSGIQPSFPDRTRSQSSGRQMIIQNSNNAQLKSNSHLDKENVRWSSRLRVKREGAEHANSVVHKTQTLGGKNSNLLGNHNTKKSSKLRNLDGKKEVKAQIVTQEDMKSRLRKPIAQASKDKMLFDTDSGHQPGFPVRRRSQPSEMPKKIVQKKKKINSNVIDQENVSQSSRLQFNSSVVKNAKPVVHKTQALKRKDSNVMEKQSFKLRNLEDENEVKAQIGETNLKCPKSLRERKKLKTMISKLAQDRKGSMDLFEDEEHRELMKDSDNSSSGNNDRSKLWDIDLLSNVGSHDTSSFSLATTPAKLMKLCVSSTPAPSPASSYCKTPNTYYADNYIHRQLKKKKKCEKKIEKCTVLQATNLNSSSQVKADEAYEALITGKVLPKSLFQFKPRLDRSSFDSLDESYSSN